MSVKNMFSSFFLVEEVKRLYKMLNDDVPFSAQIICTLCFCHLQGWFMYVLVHALILRNLNGKFYIFCVGMAVYAF